MYRHILIATDGSELAAKGVQHGLALAGPLGAKVTVLTVSEPLQPEAEHAALAAGVIVAVIASQRLGTGDVQGELGGYQLIDDETLSVTIKVTRADPSRPVVCIVRARSYDGDEVGRRELLVAPSSAETVQVRTTVTTSRPAVVGDVYGCGTDVPPYLVSG